MPNQPLHACAACKSLRKKCTPQCVFSPYFPPNETEKWTTVHRTFGASNISKILTTVPPGKRTAAANSLIFEAEARLADPVYGTLQVIHRLGNRLSSLHKELQAVRAENEELRQKNGQVCALMGIPPNYSFASEGEQTVQEMASSSSPPSAIIEDAAALLKHEAA